MGEGPNHPIRTIVVTATVITLAIVVVVSIGWMNRQEPTDPYAPTPSATATQE
jgi:hypothetical protein